MECLACRVLLQKEDSGAPARGERGAGRAAPAREESWPAGDSGRLSARAARRAEDQEQWEMVKMLPPIPKKKKNKEEEEEEERRASKQAKRDIH